jgi:hypothetical protein
MTESLCAEIQAPMRKSANPISVRNRQTTGPRITDCIIILAFSVSS